MNEVKDVRTISEVVHFAAKAAAEAHREVFTQSGNVSAAEDAARMAYRANLPTLESRASVQAYLAAVTRGMEMHLISVREGRQLIWAARIWMTAERKQAARSTANEDRPNAGLHVTRIRAVAI